MNISTNELLSAVNSGELIATAVDPQVGPFPEIVLSLKKLEFARICYLRFAPPSVWADTGQFVVFVRPSTGLGDGFDVQCDTAEDANSIAKSLKQCLDTEYARAFDA